MIQLTKINGHQITLNPDLIEFIEETPDTVITLMNNDKIVVKDRMTEIIAKVVHYRRMVARLIEDEYERQMAKG